MQITLTKELEKFVTTKVRSGGYADASEVIREALRDLRSQEDPAEIDSPELAELLLPAVGTWQKQPAGRVRWQPVQRLRDALWDVLRIVTAFTVAHSITLSLATLGLVSLPSRLVESVIAASVVLAALNNVWPLFQGRRWSVAFAFGLILGFGFASVLADLGLPQDALALALVGFNVGVELGQLAIVVAFLPLAFVLRDSAFYRRAVLVAGSLLIAAIALAWFLERAFQIPVFPA